MKKSAATRQAILQKAFELIYEKGYQGTSIDDIISNLEVTKGAFFYHFKNKEEMALAMIRELMSPVMLGSFVEPLKNTRDPVMDIYGMIKNLLFGIPDLKVKYGCPAGNLVQEMAPISVELSGALSVLVTEIQRALSESIENGKATGTIRQQIASDEVACVIISGYWGVRGLGKLYNSTDCYHLYLKGLKAYLRSLE
jgi:TetR/AcrR family transcriptional regulator, transcriptional repressor for nem operon